MCDLIWVSREIKEAGRGVRENGGKGERRKANEERRRV